MSNVSELTNQLVKAIDQEIAQLQAKRDALVNGSPRPAKKPRRTSVNADEFVTALQSLGGAAPIAEIVEVLDVTNGNALTGARTAAQKDGRVVYDDGIWKIA